MSVSGNTIANIAYGAVVLAFGVALIRMCRNLDRSEDERAEAARRRVGLMPIKTTPRNEWVYDGPDSLLLLEDLEAHMKAYDNAVADLYEPATADHFTAEGEL